jgi:hypothetical protein
MVKCIRLLLPNGLRIQIFSGSLALIRQFSRFERLSISVNFERATKRPAFSPVSNWVRVLTTCCLIFSVVIAGCVPAFLQRQPEIPIENTASEKPQLLKPKVAEDGADAAARIGDENPRISRNSKSPSQLAPADPSSKSDKQDSFPSEKSEKPKPEDRKFNSDSPLGKEETSDPARRIAAKDEDSTSSDADDGSQAAKPIEQFKRHDHAKYMELVKNKAIDLVNSEKECDQATICKDMITDQWSLALYYMKEKTYKFITYVWDEIDDSWQKSFTSDKRQISGLEKHLKYSSSGKDCKVLKKARR